MKLLLIVLALCIPGITDARIPRSYAAKVAFVKANACPATKRHKLPCPGYIIDHIDALACGGKDAPSNMQWQTVAEAKAKDKCERKDCRK